MKDILVEYKDNLYNIVLWKLYSTVHFIKTNIPIDAVEFVEATIMADGGIRYQFDVNQCSRFK